MSERPILFSAPMVRALLVGTKTQTRRAINPQPPEDVGDLHVGPYHPTIVRRGEEEPGAETFGVYSKDGSWATRCPYGAAGDRLWVRETFYCDSAFYPDGVGVDCMWREVDGQRVAIPVAEQRAEMLAQSMYYRADGEPEWEGAESPTSWRPSIHMPRWASRITLKVVSVRVERLQDISEADSIAEGAVGHPDGPWHAYRSLWSLINGAGSWDANPWVWCVEFQQL